MKTLLLLAAITTPALAVPTPVKTFGDWEVFNINGVLRATSEAQNPSANTLRVSCNPRHHNCYMQYTQPKGCHSNDERNIIWTSDTSTESDGYMTRCINGQWTDISFYENSIPTWLHSTTGTFKVGFADDNTSINTYSLRGALKAMRYIWANRMTNNFNQG
ncbi:hypothetical protein D5018_11730 [Parashewanella curva]|uniref:DUF3617 family protein n=1 Tax=Parashewanella curva TaxID=2338552 RepID=A0A3L8PY28_9GAMM|nr:hypothetical protein [Parashewanella curva]RLV59533.1 hypothetical protein D5018_11730 [Parashewanella curva]